MNWSEVMSDLPAAEEVTRFCHQLAEEFGSQPCEVAILPSQEAARHVAVRHVDNQKYVRMIPPLSHNGGRAFYLLWQPSPLVREAPLLLHLPGYGAGFSLFPDLQSAGYHVLHLSPLGYVTPEGRATELQRDGVWPVMAETVESFGQRGYREMLQEAFWAISWAMQQPRVHPTALGLFGTSQGGGLALLLASILRERFSCVVAAHLPFLTDFANAPDGGSYQIAKRKLSESTDAARAARALTFLDTLSHAHRLSMPVLLTAGGQDRLCPVGGIRKLYEKLPGIRALHETPNQGHVYSVEALRLTQVWFDLYL